jgi:hypothetical protein
MNIQVLSARMPARLALALVLAVTLLLVAQRPLPLAHAETFDPTYTVMRSDYGNLKKGDITSEITLSGADATLWHSSSFPPNYFRWPRLEVVAHGEDIPIGAKIGTYHYVTTVGLINNPCTNPVAVDFDLLNATTDTSVTVSHSAGVLDSNANGLPDAVDKYPDTLLSRTTLKPRLRLYGQTNVAGTPWVINVAIFDPEQTGDPSDRDVYFYIDPTDPSTPAPYSVTDFCNPTDATMVNLAVSLDNPNTAANEAGYDVLHNPFLAGAYSDQAILYAFPDRDNDGIDNSLDSCPTVTNTGTDADGDGIDSACDPNDGSANSDQDGDSYLNRQDNCPLVANSTQADVDQDGIGAACDANDNDPGSITSALPGSSPYTITGSSDTDGDGWDDNTETYLGTDVSNKCAASSTANNEALPDRWPLDFNDSQNENASDLLYNTPPPPAPPAGVVIGLTNGTFAVRDDLYPDGDLDVHDLAAFKTGFGQTCTGTPPAPATPVDGSPYTYGIDTDPTGNDPRLSTGFPNGLQRCRSVSGIGTSFDVDLYVKAPVSANPLAGYQYTLQYDPSIIQLQSVDESQLLTQAAGSSSPVSVDDPTPDTSGDWTSRVIDLGAAGLEPSGADENGPGVLARLTFKTIATGQSYLFPANVQLVTSTNGTAPSSTFDQYVGTSIVVDGACPPNSVLTVNDTGTAGDMAPGDGACYTITYVCTLTAALEEANADFGADTIHFNIPGGGVHTIVAPTGLPDIEEAVTIDGTTQPGYAGTPLIELTPGTTCFCDGVFVDAATTTVKGLYIHGYDAGVYDIAGAVIQGNTITGNDTGILLNGPGNLVGGSGAGEGNIISGNASDGIEVDSTGNTIQGNKIGLAADGSALGNGGDGIFFNVASSNVVGGTGVGEANTISANGGAGVSVVSSCSDGCVYAVADSIRGNSIYANTGLGIALSSGSNNSMNAPVVTSAVYDGVHTTVTGTLTTGSPTTTAVDIYSTQVGDPEGHFYLGAATPDGSGNWQLIYSGPPPYGTFTATATDSAGNTSEFSAAYAPPVGPGLPLTTVASQGQSTPIGGTFSGFGPAGIPGTPGDAVFWASVTGGSATEGIFKNSGGTITKIAAKGDATPIGGTYSGFTTAPVINPSGEIAFWASVSGGSAASAIFKRSSGGVVSKIAAVGDATPAGSTYTGFTASAAPPVPIINAGGDVSFFATRSTGGEAIFLYKSLEAVIVKVAANGDSAPTGGTFTGFSGGVVGMPLVNDLRQVSFRASLSTAAATGVFLWDSGLMVKIAAGGDLVPNGGGAVFTSFGLLPGQNDEGDYVFSGTFAPSNQGIYIKSPSGITKVVATGDPGPAGVAGSVTSIGGIPIINGSGELTVWLGVTDAFGSTTEDIVRYGSSTSVAAVGNATPIGGTFSSFFVGGSPTVPIVNSSGQVSFTGSVSGGSGTSGIFVSSAPPSGTNSVHLGPIEGATVPGSGGGTLGPNFDLALNRNGQAVFQDSITGGTANSGVFLFFAGSPTSHLSESTQQLQPIALQGGSAPGGGMFASFFSPVVNDSGTTAFRATLSSGEGLYLFFAGSAQPQKRVGSAGTFASFGNPTINSGGDLAVQATNDDSSRGLYLFFAGSGQQTVAVTNGSDGSGDTFCVPSPTNCTSGTFGQPSVNIGRDTAFTGKLGTGSQSGLYLFFANAPHRLAKTGTPIGEFTFSAFGDNPVVDDSSTVIVSGTANGSSGLFMFTNTKSGSPTVTKLADTSLASGVSGNFTGFGTPVITPFSPTQPSAVSDATFSGAPGEGLFLFFAGSPGTTPQRIVTPGDTTIENAAVHFSGTYPVFPYYAVNNNLSAVFVAKTTGVTGSSEGVFFASLDQDGDGVPDYIDNCPTAVNASQTNTDQARHAVLAAVVADNLGDACDPDEDGDGALNNPHEPNPQCDLLPDCDGDGYLDGLEAFMGTNATMKCAVDSTANNEPLPDAWPPDFNDDQKASVLDVSTFSSRFGAVSPAPAYNVRWDFNADGKLNVLDVSRYSSIFNKSCFP